MNIDLLIKMTNEIGEFFARHPRRPPEAARAVANHLSVTGSRRDARADDQLLRASVNGAGLTELARSAVALMVADSKAQASAGAASRGAKA